MSNEGSLSFGTWWPMFATNFTGKGLKGVLDFGIGRARAIAEVKENLLLIAEDAMVK